MNTVESTFKKKNIKLKSKGSVTGGKRACVCVCVGGGGCSSLK
jgi:hypothetical protein